MMGIKERAFGPLPPVSLEDLVPPDHFYRHLERSLDLSFVRELVRDTYADIGRPSIDPVVFFKLQLILFFEGLRSERQLMRVVADRLSLRWYLGYDLTEPLPDHSSLTRLRERYGLDVFRRFFEAIVEQCIAAGLVWGQELYVDSTDVAGNAAHDSLRPALRRRGPPGRPLPRSGARHAVGRRPPGRRRRCRGGRRAPAPDAAAPRIDGGCPGRSRRGGRRPARLDRGGRPPGPQPDERSLPPRRRFLGQHDRPRRLPAAADRGRRRPRLPRPLRRRRRQGADRADRRW